MRAFVFSKKNGWQLRFGQSIFCRNRGVFKCFLKGCLIFLSNKNVWSEGQTNRERAAFQKVRKKESVLLGSIFRREALKNLRRGAPHVRHRQTRCFVLWHKTTGHSIPLLLRGARRGEQRTTGSDRLVGMGCFQRSNSKTQQPMEANKPVFLGREKDS